MSSEGPSQPQQHFIAIATGQQSANLPPILQLGRKADRVTFLATPEIIRDNKVDQAVDILRKRGFDVYVINLKGSDIDEFATHTSAVIKSLPDANHIAVINGGKKPWIVAMVGACTPNTRLAYSETPKSEVVVFSNHNSIEQQRINFDFAPPLSLEELLACANAELQSKPVQVWDAKMGRVNLEPPQPETDDEVDQKFELAERNAQSQKSAEKSDYPSADQALSGNDDYIVSLRQTLKDVFTQMSKSNHENHIANDQLKKIVGSARKLLANARKNLSTKLDGDSDQRIGPDFERRVADAVVAYVDKHPRIKQALSSIWTGIEVQSLKSQERKGAEWDIALIFRNGAIMHLECKTVKTTVKDMDARKGVLPLLSSDAATFVLVIPGYTKYADKIWFQNLTEFGRGTKHTLRLTRPNQQPTFMDKSVKPAVEATIPPFEEQLDKLFEPFTSSLT